MTRQPSIARRAEQLLGRAVVSTAPVAGGDVATATKLRLADGSQALMKTLPHCPETFFASEARGLAWLGEAGGVRVPDVLAVETDCLILRWIEPGRANAEEAEALGRALATTHRAGADGFGAAEDGFIARLPLPNKTAPTWPEFFATRRVLPYLKVAHDRGALDDDHVATIERALARLGELVPEEPPARLHGDLWTGNVLWSHEGHAYVIDPAAHGGHRETDLAMLALFGLPHLDRLQEAYDEAYPLAEGWADRLGLHQLFPLLVHACLFGGGYGVRAAQTAARYL
ncbi:fructosamine kinase family protein [Nocardioides sp.]|jgi:fructosamine-3-kinase|uniref:fructosamine kinase family protein n=1 Tax=Nocardioides sp. TaxID=35761 RepID=UPI002BBB0EF0|nr:fructosamine kinase family protein [Nocardioides sp.]HVX54341.1 fructosamine kinase family protein [Nocardioides sp.]